MDILSAEQTRARLPYSELADSIAAMLHSPYPQTPKRVHMSLAEEGTLLLMPAADDKIAMTKLVSIHPHNAEANLPTIQGEMVVLNAATGVRKGIIDGAIVSERRTAALSLLAARELAPVVDSPVVVVGAGVQARSHIEAFTAGLGSREFHIHSRTRSRADALAADVSTALGVRAYVIDSFDEVPTHARLYITVTTSREPVLPDCLPDNSFVAAVGAFKPDMAELTPQLIANSRVVVDSLDGAKSEAGDLIQAAAAGAFDWNHAQRLSEVLDGATSGTGPLLFKSVGHPLWDLAAAHLAFV